MASDVGLRGAVLALSSTFASNCVRLVSNWLQIVADMVSNGFRLVSNCFKWFRTVSNLFQTVGKGFRTVSDGFQAVPNWLQSVSCCCKLFQTSLKMFTLIVTFSVRGQADSSWFPTVPSWLLDCFKQVSSAVLQWQCKRILEAWFQKRFKPQGKDTLQRHFEAGAEYTFCNVKTQARK